MEGEIDKRIGTVPVFVVKKELSQRVKLSICQSSDIWGELGVQPLLFRIEKKGPVEVVWASDRDFLGMSNW